MLDYLYTSQYQMGGVVAISLGPFLPDTVPSIITFSEFVSLAIALGYGVIGH